MSLIPQRSIMGAAASTASQLYNVKNSVLLNASGTTEYMIRTFGRGNKQLWTWSGWVKRTQLSTMQTLFAASASPGLYTAFGFTSGDAFFVQQYDGSANTIYKVSNAPFRDVTGWLHVVVAYDANQATAEDRVKIYINNQRITSFGANTNPTSGLDTYINTPTWQHTMGVLQYPSPGTFTWWQDGYVCETTFVDNAALTPSSFGQTNKYTNQWSPKPYTGSFGSTGFYLPYNDTTSLTTLGYDRSGLGNNWTINSYTGAAWAIATPDVPTTYPDGGKGHGNYCTLSALNSYDQGTYAPTNAGRLYTYGGAAWLSVTGTQYMTSGKWYAECNINTLGGTYGMFGVSRETWTPIGRVAYPGESGANSWGFLNNGYTYYNGAAVTLYNTFANGDIIGIALDLDNGKLWFSINGTWQGSGNPTNGTNPAFTIPVGNGEAYTFAFGVYQNSVLTNFGQRNFLYAPPTGFKTMNTSNYPEPVLKDTSRAMASTLYTGNGTTQTITNTGFTPSLTWIKGRTSTSNNVLVDVIRGAQYNLYSDSTSAQQFQNQFGYVDSITSSGFVPKTGSTDATNTNVNGNNYVAWQWAANAATAVTNTDGTQTTTVCANPATGFSIVKADIASPGGAAITLGHGLGKAPQMIITKSSTSTNNWYVYNKNIGPTYHLTLNTTGDQGYSTTLWNSTNPTSSVFTLGSDWTAATYTGIFYCWTEIPGYSKFGTYVGNGSTNGTYVPCGFRPKYVMYKAVNAGGSGESWVTLDASRDVTNVEQNYLVPNTSQAEGSTPLMDFTSNGFKLRIGGGAGNASGVTYIFMAFAENPAKYSLAR